MYDTLPSELFTDLDVPIDLIVTPTQVIRVAKRLPRPTGIRWTILSQRRLGVVPVLQAIKDHETASGKVIVLKDEDTDVETNRRPKSIRRFVKRTRKGRSAGENGKVPDETGGRTRYRRKSKVNLSFVVCNVLIQMFAVFRNQPMTENKILAKNRDRKIKMMMMTGKKANVSVKFGSVFRFSFHVSSLLILL